MVAKTLNKWLKGALCGFLALFLCCASYVWGHSNGVDKGVDAYHSVCYNSGGIVLDESTGTAVQCSPLTKLPQKELDNLQKI